MEISKLSLNEIEMSHQFRNRAKMSAEDVIATVPRAAQSHLEQRGNFLPLGSRLPKKQSLLTCQVNYLLIRLYPGQTVQIVS